MGSRTRHGIGAQAGQPPLWGILDWGHHSASVPMEHISHPPSAASWTMTSGINFTHLCPKAQGSVARGGFSALYTGAEHAGNQSHQPSPQAEPPPYLSASSSMT